VLTPRAARPGEGTPRYGEEDLMHLLRQTFAGDLLAGSADAGSTASQTVGRLIQAAASRLRTSPIIFLTP